MHLRISTTESNDKQLVFDLVDDQMASEPKDLAKELGISVARAKAALLALWKDKKIYWSGRNNTWWPGDGKGNEAAWTYEECGPAYPTKNRPGRSPHGPAK